MMGSDMDRFTVLSRTRSDSAGARGAISNVQWDWRPLVGIRPVFDRGPRLAPSDVGGDLESHYRGPGRALRRVAPGGGFVFSCSLRPWRPREPGPSLAADRRPERGRSGCPYRRAPLICQPLRDVSGAG